MRASGRRVERSCWCATDGLGPHLERRRKGGGDVSTCPSIARSRSHTPSAAPPPSSHRPTQKKSFERRTFLLAAAKLAAHAFCHQLRSPAAILFPQPRHACPPPLLSAQHRSRVSARAARRGRQTKAQPQRHTRFLSAAAAHELRRLCRPAAGCARPFARRARTGACMHARTRAWEHGYAPARSCGQVRFIWDFLSVPDMPLLTRRAKPVGLRGERRSRETSMRP